MRTIPIARLIADNEERLDLRWIAGRNGGDRSLSRDTGNQAEVGLVGHMNFIHPFRIQVIGPAEMSYLERLPEAERMATFERLLGEEQAGVCVCGVGDPRPYMVALCDQRQVPLITTSQPSPFVVDVLRLYLARVLAAHTTLHGVFLDVLEVGVLITGASAIGKSELALELITRGHGLIADDIVEVYRLSPDLLEGRCPEVLRDFLEVRGIGVLNIRTVFGETAVRPRKSLKLIVHLEELADEQFKRLDRMSVNATYQEILGVKVRKVVIPVAAGRNLAVLVEAAVRNFVLNLRGIDSTREFIERQARYMEQG
ncbi:MAG: HPr(Ser) kinase/phosphatase [Casimicrobiaceae bacterium]|nr:HPr(Ser) kinase/phosphatase [Casimicrobiaceae bacterium]MCX8097461.1 HPr(Ser) kinase/phosphatase [Casimicrobiaceae bacterium]MDW8311179.1 HPr(Ser) kinase/phosphatase [Burkholderiales bacterium]